VRWRLEGQTILNGIVVVGLTNNTTSESSGNEVSKRKEVTNGTCFGKVWCTEVAKEPRLHDETNSESYGSDRGRRQAARAASPQAPESQVGLKMK
jgi:hypothetical protein